MVRIPASVKQIGNDAFNGIPESGWIRWDNCASDAYIGSNGLGSSGYVLAPIDSPAHVYCKNNTGKHFSSTLVRDFVERCYQKILGRASDESGLLNWCGHVSTGTRDGATLVKSFMDSPEFVNKGYSNAQAVEILYNTMLDRTSDAPGKAHWTSFLNNGMTKDYIINGFAISNEFTGLCKTYLMTPGSLVLQNARDKNEKLTAFVARCYTKALNRPFDVDGLEHWCAAILNKTRTPAKVVYDFFFSKEFIDQKNNNDVFVNRLYQTYFDRAPDPSGYANWMALLEADYSREYVNNGFANSEEFAELLKTFGLK